MQQPPNDFWGLTGAQLAMLIGMAGLFFSFWSAHKSNIRRIEQDAQDRQEIKTKLDLIFNWFQQNIVGRRGHGQEGD